MGFQDVWLLSRQFFVVNVFLEVSDETFFMHELKGDALLVTDIGQD